MTTVTGVLLVLLLVLVTLLAIPLTVSFRVSWPQTSENTVRLCWLSGIVSLRLPLQGNSAKKDQERKAGRQSVKNSPGKKNVLTGGAPLQRRELVTTLLRFARRTWQSIEKKDVRVWLHMGLGDPADTGMLWGSIWPLATFFAEPAGISVELVPEFTESVLEMNAGGSLRFIPLQLIALIIGVVATPAVWRSFR